MFILVNITHERQFPLNIKNSQSLSRYNYRHKRLLLLVAQSFDKVHRTIAFLTANQMANKS